MSEETLEATTTDPIDMDNPEVQKFARVVQNVAREFAIEHSLCEQVEVALDAMGIGSHWMPITVKIAQVYSVNLEVDEAQWKDLDEQGKKDFLKRAAQADGSRFDPTSVTIGRNLGVKDTGAYPSPEGWEVQSIEEGKTPMNSGASAAPMGMTWRVITGSSTQHLVQDSLYTNAEDGLADPNVPSACGRVEHLWSEWATAELMPTETRCNYCQRMTS